MTRTQAATRKLRVWLFTVLGTIALCLGIIGIVIPVLPTTPFLLLAAVCYARGSKRLYNALMRNRFVGGYLGDYLEGRGMSRKVKALTLILLWAAMICAAGLATDSLIVRLILAVVSIGITVHILMTKTARKDTPTFPVRPE